MFQPKDKVVHPVHGACEIVGVCEREVRNEMFMYYSFIPLTDPGMTLMVPVEKAEELGMRKVISSSEADAMMSKMQSVEAHCENDNKKRHQHYALVGKSCDLLEMASLLKELNERERSRGLAFSEKKVYQDISKKLCSEIAFAKAISMEEAARGVEEVLFALA